MADAPQSKRRRFRFWWPFAGLGALVVLIIIALAAGYLWLRGSLPQTDGEMKLAGLDGRVEVVRDKNDVPHIFASTAHDAYFAMGFVHAQDRLWQMEFQRRVGAGRLSEIFGEVTVDTDRFLRTLGVYRVAERNLAQLEPDARAVYEAYAAGVNAYLKTRSGPLPLEFLLLSHEPEPWRAADSVVWLKMLAWDLGGNAFEEALRARLAKHLSTAQLHDLWPDYPDDAPTTLSDSADLIDKLPFEALAGALPFQSSEGRGSNNWVIAGSHTESGKPLLANDPHLGLQIPSQWYLAHISTPEFEVIGATLPGLPVPILGRTKTTAWGFTNTNPDVQDLFIERLDPSDPGRYLTPDGSEAFTERTETILVKDGEDVQLTVRETRHGPVVSDLIKGSDEFVQSGHVLAFAWTALMDDDRSAQAAVRATLAHDWDGFVAALRDFHAPQQNMVFADTFGNIGFIAPARVPIRRSGNGWLPSPGWTGQYDWQGFIPYQALPRLFNPPSGEIATANNRIVGPDYPYFLTNDWAPPYRVERIEALLAAREQHNAESFAEIQRDQTSLAAAQMVPQLIELAHPDSEEARAAVGLLADWDHLMAADRPEPLIYMAWLREMMRGLFADELGDVFKDYWSIRVGAIERAIEPGSPWCDDTTTAEEEDCSAVATAALERALAYLRERLGNDAGAWRWGDAHQAHYTHRVLGRIPGIGAWFEIRRPNGGEKDTVNAGGFAINDDATAFLQNHGPTYRAIYDLADPDRSVFIQNTGQSGNPLSPHYRDLAKAWYDGQYLSMTMDRASIEDGAIGTLVLSPN